MRKQLFIRFFIKSTSVFPHESRAICDSTTSKAKQDILIGNNFEEITDWMGRYEHGKVDFVWL